MHFYRSRLKLFNTLVVLMLSIASCTPDNVETNVTTNASSPTVTAAPNTSTPLPIPSPTLSLTPTIQIEDRCLTLEESLPNDFQLEGVWVRQESKPYLENLVENTKYRVPFEGGGWLYNYEGYWSVSPNGEWLAYIDTVLDATGRAARKKGDLLKVIHASGYFLSMDYWPMTNQSIQGWVDDKNLLLKLDQRSIVLNPFSGKWHELIQPDWLSSLTVDNPWQYESKKYSPHLESVIVNQADHFEIRDLISGNTLFRDDELGLYDKIAWSPDVSMLAIATKDGSNISIFHNNEKILTLDLLKDPSLTSRVGNLGYISKLEWSLNNQRLLVNYLFGNILLLDVKEQKLYKACVDNKEINIAGFWEGFLSSKTGQYIVIPVYIRDKNFKLDEFDVLIDTNTLRAYKLPTSKYNGRIGWLALPDSTEK